MDKLINFINRLSVETIEHILSELRRDLPALTIYNPVEAIKVSQLIAALENGGYQDD